jgi:hypothetical protein
MFPLGFSQRPLKTRIEKVLLYANRNLSHRTPDWDVQPVMVPTDTDDVLRPYRLASTDSIRF